MKNVEKTRSAATHAAMMINTWHLAFTFSAANAAPSSQGVASIEAGSTTSTAGRVFLGVTR
jgi:hypothetical protein